MGIFKDVISRFTPQQVAFRSGIWISFLMHKISQKTRHLPQELKGAVLNQVIIMEWWHPRCSQCKAKYRYITEKKVIKYSVDKTDMEKPVCKNCGAIWTYAALHLQPNDMLSEFEWTKEIKGNAPKVGQIIDKSFEEADKYFIQMYDAAEAVRNASSGD